MCSVVWNSDAEMLAQGSIWAYHMLWLALSIWCSGYLCCYIDNLLVSGLILVQCIFVYTYNKS